MGRNIAQKILKEHVVHGRMVAGKEIAIRIDQTLTQDATGTMAYLQFESMGIPRVRTKLSVSYVDHNTLQSGFENADDHRYLQTAAARYGVHFSRPGNGICHQVHLERFGVPGETLLGSDSHTPTAGGLGMLGIGAGGLDVAVAMGGGAFHLVMPEIINVNLTGQLPPWVSAKDVILELLRIMTVKGGVGKIIEYGGDGVKTLSVPQRATITNMGAELGATTSVFPSDSVTRAYLRWQQRQDCWRRIQASKTATYDGRIEINLSELEPLVAQPHSPDAVCKVRDIEGLEVSQVAIGSCTNSSLADLQTAAAILKGKKVHPNVSLVMSPGSRQVFEMIARSGALADLISSGARILESACGPCIGMGQAPPTDGVSVRTFNRNFKGRSGTASGRIYLTSPEVAAATAVAGKFVDPRQLGELPVIKLPRRALIDDGMIIHPPEDGSKVRVVRGPNIKACPLNTELAETIKGEVLLKVGDNITTDHIMPAGAKILPLRSNIPAIAEYVFSGIDPGFPKRARDKEGGIVVGAVNYGQGSSREHASLAPMHLGVKAVIAKSFARIHKANLVNFGIVPLTFVKETDYGEVQQDDLLEVPGIREALAKRKDRVMVSNLTRNKTFAAAISLTPREADIVLAGGLLNYTRLH
ncbi:aconitate hydratase [bacterium]|nr:aconitate hydratase [bacterium]